MGLYALIDFTRTLRSSTAGAVYFYSFYTGSVELCGRPSVFSLIYEDPMQLYGWACVFSLILQGLYAALRLALCIFIHITRALGSSTVGLVCFHTFYKGSTQLYGWR